MAGENFFFTNEILDRAQDIKKKHNLTWNKVAKRLGCSTSHLEKTLSERKKGKWKGFIEKRQKERDEIESDVKTGKSVTGIARARKVSVSAVSRRLTRMGLDAEMREELRNSSE